MSINSVTGNTLLESGFFAPCRVATTGPITLSGDQTIDGVALIDGDRVLVWQQADAKTNGIYAASSGTWVRTTDAATNAQFFDGMAVAIARGTQAGLIFQCTCTDDPVVVGASQLIFAVQNNIVTQSQSSTSTSSVAVGLGAQTFATQSGKSYAVNQWVLVYDAGGNAMLGQITAYAGGNLTISVTATSGSGTHADWSIVLANSPASAGLMPPLGTGNVTGPGSSTAGHVPTFSDATGKVLQDSGVSLGTLAGRNQLQYGDAAAASIPQSALAPGAAPLQYAGSQPNYNLLLSNDGTNPTRDLDITPGRCRDDADRSNLQLAGAMVKRLDLAFSPGGAAGSPQGACDTGAKGANQTWHVYLIGNEGLSVSSVSRAGNFATITVAGHTAGVGSTVRVAGVGSGFDGLAVVTAITAGTISFANSGSDVGATVASANCDIFDVFASQSYNAATPSGWTSRQCLGSIITDGSANIRGFLQAGDQFLLIAPVTDLAVTNSGTNIYAISSLPLGVSMLATVSVSVSAGTAENDIRVYSPLVSSEPAGIGVPNSAGVSIVGASTTAILATVSDVLTNSSAQLGIGTSQSVPVRLSVLSWRDLRRRLF